MKMKTFFLKHAVAVAAIAIASLSLMSFGLEDNQASQWYAVETDEQTIDYNSPLPPPGNSGECKETFNKNLCAIEILNGATPETVSDAVLEGVAGDRAHSQLEH
ncbi:hypothetical protein ORI89_13160 [Sphingobacterium sp. UT-1RO-CII-1]|uniref:hypothetical protein n=1 Tax=Sphingobacterium sp. UT-1RO-CII-1 TaxID=2995225 RepID=UPI00227B2FFF|nr:hypothetical protein [Sphingobacterium sp. UT-1RO-CII-1]MCY4780603.1 hypothetical protein [Sphingobacterium sp. UT-1RO-CII-1]